MSGRWSIHSAHGKSIQSYTVLIPSQACLWVQSVHMPLIWFARAVSMLHRFLSMLVQWCFSPWDCVGIPDTIQGLILEAVELIKKICSNHRVYKVAWMSLVCGSMMGKSSWNTCTWEPLKVKTSYSLVLCSISSLGWKPIKQLTMSWGGSPSLPNGLSAWWTLSSSRGVFCGCVLMAGKATRSQNIMQQREGFPHPRWMYG